MNLRECGSIAKDEAVEQGLALCARGSRFALGARLCFARLGAQSLRSFGLMNRMTSKIAIIGAGFAGIAIAIELQQVGISDFTIYEAADEIGGTWRDNTYPGAACDVPSHVYSFSFEPNPRWSRAYSGQSEILAYMKRVVQKYDLEKHIVFDTQIIGAELNERDGEWTIYTADGGEIETRVLMLGVGALNHPRIPDIPGLQDFDRPHWHSARWNHDFDLKGKRVGVVGTGASAIQFIPEIAKEVEHLYVFQRTPPWCLPRPDREYRNVEKTVFKHVPGARWLYRSAIYWSMEARGTGFTKDKRILKLFQATGKRHLKKSVSDPKLREMLTPDYVMGCKRILFTNDFYPAMARDNVTLIPHAVDSFTEGQMHAAGQTIDVDAAIFGTGFHVTDFLTRFEIIGRGGTNLNDAWKEGAEAYYGVAVSGFPNLYIFAGPNTGLGHNSIIFMLECQAHLIRQCVQTLFENDARLIDVRPAVQAEFNDSIQKRLEKSVWNSGGCHSWYVDDSGKNTTLWPGYTWQYWLETRKMDGDAFVISY